MQFLPAFNQLIKDAIDERVSFDYGKINTYFVPLEYLIAIMLDTFRPKDKNRLYNLLETIGDKRTDFPLKKRKLISILKRHNLIDKYNDFIEKNRD